ncbi:unnamed protein product [Bursaphelenchus xylophilus]|uniref:(pine wood nematode) hypothetical protein n=1 Tax=Bursaphelenchus xylophilus TaxID=6326 RepID=A0A1I7SRM7_BURXY|nr:unnamed protein product [Bursaphelenchus xylophilus]CAD5217941.1 unnamed protein product [Bursaphelenchus xylophilus]CAG9102115.1 unnamed protein product [Bursaphelenchus xylophilus]CAG9102123.1 unnamed protein product [Bursaphelenchus xylophilus]
MVDVDFSVKDLHHQPVIISIVSINSYTNTVEELEWCFRPGPSRSLMINGKQYTFDISEVGIHQTCHAMRTPGGNGVMTCSTTQRHCLPIVVWDQSQKQPFH